MTVPAIFISLVALTGIAVSNTNTEYIELESFDVGQCIEASYAAPITGRTSVDLIAADGTGTVILHVDYRKEWGSRANSFILNSNIGGWGREQVVEGVVTTPGMVMALEICAQDANFSISLNGLEIAIYPYRINVNITRKVEFNSWEYDSILLTLGTGSSQLAVTEGGLSLGQVLGIIVGCVTAFILVMILLGVLIHIGNKCHVARLEAHGRSSRRGTSNFTTLA